MLAELMRLRSGIAVAGAHGKTTTTSMVALVLERAGLDPTAVIGGKLCAFGSNARLGSGEYMVVEADESDRSFLRLTPTVAVVTNIDDEHLEAYRDFDDLQQAFVDFANKVPFYGAVDCLSSTTRTLRRSLPRVTRRVITYGLDAADADVRGTDVAQAGGMWTCQVVPGAGLKARPGWASRRRRRCARCACACPGRHNLQNALAAVAVGLELGIDARTVAGALAEFRGAERRFQRRGEADGVLVIDDYGHHPTEIARGARRGAGLARPPPGGRLPAAPLHADRPAAWTASGRRLRRPTSSCSRTSTRRARIRSPGDRRGAGRRRSARSSRAVCTWSGRSTTWCTAVVRAGAAG